MPIGPTFTRDVSHTCCNMACCVESSFLSSSSNCSCITSCRIVSLEETLQAPTRTTSKLKLKLKTNLWSARHISGGVYPYLPMATNAPWSILGGGMNRKLLKHVFALYNLPIIFSKNFLAHYARLIAFYPQLTNASMQCVLPTRFIYFHFFVDLVSLSLTASLQSSVKNTHKIAQNCV